MLVMNTAPLELPRRRASTIDSLVAGITGAILGMVATLIFAALGSAVGWTTPVGLLGVVFLVILGCLVARCEFRRGEQAMAEFLLSTAVAGGLTGLAIVIGLACSSLLFMQLGFGAGLAAPMVLARWA